MTGDRRAAALPFVLLGSVCVIAGGLVAAITATAPSELASWAAAYLVLVAGVAQVALGAGQAVLAVDTPSGRAVTLRFAGWNVGNALVLAGTLVGLTLAVDVGGVIVVLTLALLIYGIRGASTRPAWQRGVFRALIVVLLVSVPVGLVLARA